MTHSVQDLDLYTIFIYFSLICISVLIDANLHGGRRSVTESTVSLINLDL